MTSTLVGRLLDRNGLTGLLAARERGLPPEDSHERGEILARADILALGAAADIARRRECADEVRIYVPSAPRSSDSITVIGAEVSARGTALLRRLATLRLTGPIGLAIVVDFGVLGLPIAQVALSFGATDLAGPMASRRALPVIAEDQKRSIKRREMAGFVERAGFRPVFVATESTAGAGEGSAGLASTRDHVQS